jgi:uncharacterized protein (TIGR00106 family)
MTIVSKICQLSDGEELIFAVADFRRRTSGLYARGRSARVLHRAQEPGAFGRSSPGELAADVAPVASFHPAPADDRAMKRPPAKKDLAASAPATGGLSTLDRDRAGSLADEGGASAATVESQDKVAQTRTEAKNGDSQGTMLFELSVLPIGGDIHLSDELARVLQVVDRSGLRYQLTAGTTYIEGPWEKVLPVIRECHDEARRASPHVVTLLRIEDDQGQQGKIRTNVESVEAKVGKSLERADPSDVRGSRTTEQA